MVKKYFSILSLALMAMCCNVVLTSCGDDDDEEKVVVEKHYSAKDLIGTWEYTPDDAPGTISSTTFFEDGTVLYFIQDKVVNPNSSETDKEGYVYKLIESYDVAGDSIYFLKKYMYKVNRYKDSMWHPLENESRNGGKFEFVDENTLKLIDSGNKDKSEIILHRNTSANVEKVEVFDKRLVGTWGYVLDGDCRDIVIFDAEGNYHHMDQDIKRDTSKKYYDDNLTYYQDKGYCNASNGTMNYVLTLEWDHKWNEVNWKEISVKGSCSYEIVDENTFKLSALSEETGKVEIQTYTRVK